MKICYTYIVSHIWMSHVIPWKVRLVLGNRNSTVCVCVCVCACVCVCMCVPLVWEVSMLRIAPCVCVCACVCVYACVCVWERDTSESFVSHIRISHVTHVNESCYTHEMVMVDRPIMSAFVCLYVCVCVRERERDTHLNESCCTSKWVVSHIWVSHVTQGLWGVYG